MPTVEESRILPFSVSAIEGDDPHGCSVRVSVFDTLAGTARTTTWGFTLREAEMLHYELGLVIEKFKKG